MKGSRISMLSLKYTGKEVKIIGSIGGNSVPLKEKTHEGATQHYNPVTTLVKGVVERVTPLGNLVIKGFGYSIKGRDVKIIA